MFIGLMAKIKIKEITESGGAAPYQLSALTECGNEIYLRYRWGNLKWGFVQKDEYIPSSYVYSEKIGDDLDGFPDDALFKEKLKDQLDFPDGFVFSY